MSENVKVIERLSWDGRSVNFYPETGVVQDPGSRKFLANFGGSKHFDPVAMANKRWGNVREAIVDGLSQAAQDINVGLVPTDMLAEIVRNRAIMAIKQNRDGNEAAKFIFQIVGTIDQDGQAQRPAMEIKFNDDMAKYAIEKMTRSDK